MAVPVLRHKCENLSVMKQHGARNETAEIKVLR